MYFLLGKDSTGFPQRLLSAVTDIQGEETKASVLEKKLENLHAQDFAQLPLAIQYGLQVKTTFLLRILHAI